MVSKKGLGGSCEVPGHSGTGHLGDLDAHFCTEEPTMGAEGKRGSGHREGFGNGGEGVEV